MKYLVVGLGNPGEEYNYTRHNIGQLVIEKLCTKFSDITHMRKNIGDFWISNLKGHCIYLFKPYCYMNESGIYIAKALKKFNIPQNKLLTIHDDKDISFGRLKFKYDGSSGGHRGIQSIINCLGKDFTRLRCGIGAADIGDTAEYVLNHFTNEEKKILEDFLEKAAEAVVYFLNEGLNNAMNYYNRRVSKQ
jgi:PTH1 family peptidyl-tRNA hydrolase